MGRTDKAGRPVVALRLRVAMIDVGDPVHIFVCCAKPSIFVVFSSSDILCGADATEKIKFCCKQLMGYLM